MIYMVKTMTKLLSDGNYRSSGRSDTGRKDGKMITKVVDICTDHSTAKLYTYFLDNSPEMDIDRKRPLVLVCPGGGYEFTSDREAEPIALQMCARGFHSCVLRYNIAPERFPTAIWELAASVAWLRAHAEEYHIDADNITICGFSAGGHLVTSLSTFWNREFLHRVTGLTAEQIRPNRLIASYPVITSGEYAHRGSFNALLGEKAEDPEMLEFVSLEKQVTEDMPPAFIWHTFSDDCVPVENSLMLANAMRKANVPFELHIFPEGPHGLALANEQTDSGDGNMIRRECAAWIDMAADWIRRG